MKKLILRLRWFIAAPILRPILREWQVVSENADRAARATGAPRDWKIECIARSEIAAAMTIEVELSFGCTSFNEKHHYVRHYN